jgi:hypothetical protein
MEDRGSRLDDDRLSLFRREAQAEVDPLPVDVLRIEPGRRRTTSGPHREARTWDRLQRAPAVDGARRRVRRDRVCEITLPGERGTVGLHRAVGIEELG